MIIDAMLSEATEFQTLLADVAALEAGIETAKELLERVKIEREIDEWFDYWNVFDCGASMSVH